MKKHLFNRLLSLVLAAVMVLGMFPVATAAPAGLRWEKSDLDVSWDKSDRLTQDEIHSQTAHKPTDLVRVSIVLEGTPTIKAGYATMGIGANAAAKAYDLDLLQVQKTMAKTISVQALDGNALDVVWNLTLVSNIISANVPYGKIDEIKAVRGVKDVVIERQYEAQSAEQAEPNMYTSAEMIGSTNVWETGYTGAGMRVAIVDTGTDTDHQSFDNDAYLYALEQNAAEKGMRYEEYVASLDLLDREKIADVLPYMNAYERVYHDDADQYYISEKLPFGANYVDYSLDVTHDNDAQGSHGSHVAGIAAANRYLEQDGAFIDARETVRMSGVAPDAQIITLKVFGNAAGPYDSDYFAAIEDAIWLGCDSVNLSLGSGSPGESTNTMFADLLDYMATTDTVVVMSAGNSGYWASNGATGYLYNDGVSFHTGGSPGTYTNALSVASVDNDGTVGKYIDVAGNMIVYTETAGYSNAPMGSLDTSADGMGTAYEYVFIDGMGKTEDYAGIDLNGKVVFCSRGEISFYEKGDNAVSLGAVATVIYNNTDGIINMDLTDYRHTAPCVSILQSDGAAVKAASAMQTTADGLVYYTGTVTIASKMGVSFYHSDFYTMSSFSSWGVPGSLALKPEITAPGGLIWSVNGVETSGTSYEMMSGTSMAAPQVTGMAALVAQYIEDNGLAEKTGMSTRHLAQSLLMSTAVPMREKASEGQYYSILNQGAGLARVDLATAAESFVIVDWMEDGKVKAELGDDPERNGQYWFSFTINNLNGEDMTYELSADLFTQDVFAYNGISYLDTWTRQLPVEATFSLDGETSLENIGYECDLNGDGKTNTADADYLLEFLLGNEEALLAEGDINGDGEINTYDAHVLLTKQTGVSTVDVPADGSVTVFVELKLPEDVKEYFDTYYPTGAYLESYVYAEPVSDAEGVAGVTHSIPVLGYYGSWSEPSMYDVGSYVEYAAGAEVRAPYLYQINGIRSNYMTINYGDGDEYLFGGNPLVMEEAYLPERNAFNNASGYTLQNLRFTQIRNASASMVLVENAETGEVYLAQEMGSVDGAYYHVNQGAWQNTQYKIGMGLDFADIPEGTRVNVSLVTAPDYYCYHYVDENGDPIVLTDWESLSEGAYLTTSFTIDNTAPVASKIEMGEGNVLNVTAQDQEYIAAVALMNPTGTSILTSTAVNQTERGAEMTIGLDLGAVFGREFLVAIYDYAENVSVYEVTLELDNERPYFTALDRTNPNDDNSISYVGLNANGSYIRMAPASGRDLARAAEYVQGTVFEISNDNKLYVGSDEDLYSFSYLRDLDPTGEHQIVGFNDLAYNMADGKLYGNFYSSLNAMAVPYLCTIDMYTGEMTVLGQMPIDANNMAIDDNGNFYSTVYGASELYTYTADVCVTGKVTRIGTLGGYSTTAINSMAWDHNADELYWACTGDSTTHLLKINPLTGNIFPVSTFDFSICGLYIAYEVTNDIFTPTEEVTAVTVQSEASTLTGSFVQLQAQVWPWNVSDNSVTWTSDNTDVATVDENGLVCGVGEGTANITAASVLDPSKSAVCTVTVSALDQELKGLVWDEVGQVHWASFNTDTIPAYTSLNAITPNLPINATFVAGGQLYASDLDTSSGTSNLYSVDPETFEMTLVGGAVECAYLDMAYAPSLGYALGVYFNYVVLIDLATGNYLGAWDWGEGIADDLVGITYYGSQYNEYYGTYLDLFLLLDKSGNVYLDAWVSTAQGMGYFYGPADGYIRSIGDPVDYSYFQGFYYDGSYTYWTRFNEADNVVELIAWDCDNTDNVYSLGTFADGVWPVGGLYADAEINGTNALADENLTNVVIKDAELLTSVPTVELSGAKGSLNAIANTEPVVRPDSSAVTDEAFGDVTVSVTLPEDATNGTFTVTYDPEKLACAGSFTCADAWAEVVDDGNGTITVAFADANAIPAGQTVSEILFFGLTTKTEYSTITVHAGELNDGTSDYSESLEVEIVHAFCGSENFVDVKEDDWFHAAVDYVVNMGYMKGMDENHFGPALSMNRAQFVTVLYRMEFEPEVNNTGVFTDVPENQFYTDAAYWALEAGITTGTSGTTFTPGRELTRTELVTFMYRYAKYKGYDDTTNADLSGYRDADMIQNFAVAPWKWAVSHGIVSGVTADTLAPMNKTNRAQAAVIFQRFDDTFWDYFG